MRVHADTLEHSISGCLLVTLNVTLPYIVFCGLYAVLRCIIALCSSDLHQTIFLVPLANCWFGLRVFRRIALLQAAWRIRYVVRWLRHIALRCFCVPSSYVCPSARCRSIIHGMMTPVQKVVDEALLVAYQRRSFNVGENVGLAQDMWAECRGGGDLVDEFGGWIAFKGG